MRLRRSVSSSLCAVALTWAQIANGSESRVREWGLRAGGGLNPSSKIEYYALHPYAGFSLWSKADRWFAARNIEARWLVEPWGAYVRDAHGKHQTDSFEIGINALFFKLTFDDGKVRPFVEAGEGLLYTDLRKQDLGTRFQFSSQLGAGLEYVIRPDLGLLLGARFRHISNAGLAKSDPGINTAFGLVGVTFR
jgi:lipid A 3-O-deacylase PagL